MPLDIDFRTRPGPPRSLWIVAALSLCVALASAAWMVDQRRAYVAAVAAQRRPQVPVRVAAPASSVPNYDATARQMWAEAASSWPAMLLALERVQVPGVSVVGLEVVVEERQLRLEVQATGAAALLRYVGDLNAGESSPRWALVQMQAGRVGNRDVTVAQLVGELR